MHLMTLPMCSHKGDAENNEEAATNYLLNYIGSNPTPCIRYQATSDVVLQVDLDEVYLVCSKTLSRAGEYH